MESSSDRLTPLQRDLLQAFFEREQGFFLTGGAALAGFYLRHRETTDLDLFALQVEAFERGQYVLRAAAEALGGDLVLRQHAPGFQRFIVTRGNEAVVVDLVLEKAAQSYPEKVNEGRI